MATKHHETQKHSKDHETKQPKSSQTDNTEKSQKRMREKDDAVRDADEAVKDHKRPDRTAGQHKADPDAGDVNEETRSGTAPFNKTYGGHE
jgi:hypothetical protein